MSEWLAATARTPHGFAALCCMTFAAFSALVCACAWVQHAFDRRETEIPDVHGDYPHVPEARP